MTTPAHSNMLDLRHDALTAQMDLIKRLKELSTNPQLTEELANQLCDKTIHYMKYDQEISNYYDQRPGPKKTLAELLKSLTKK